MAKKTTTRATSESPELEAARKTVKEADDKEQSDSDDATEVCGCNASTVPHKHLDRGIVDVPAGE